MWTDLLCSWTGGLAALGNSKGSPELLRAGRVKQIKVLKQL